MASAQHKIVLCGPPFSGKTSLLRTSVGAAMPTHQRASVQEENVKVYLLDSGDITDQAGSAGRGVVFHTWSLPGQQAAAPMATNIYMHNSSFYRHAAAAVVTLDCLSFDESAEALESNSAGGNSFNPISVGANLAAAARRNVPNISVFLCLTKCDLLKGYNKGKTGLNPVDPRVRGENARIFANAEKFISDNDLRTTLVCTSALDRNGISKLYSAIYEDQLEKKRKQEAAEAAAAGGGKGDGSGGAQQSTKPNAPVRLVLADQANEPSTRCACKSG